VDQWIRRVISCDQFDFRQDLHFARTLYCGGKLDPLRELSSVLINSPRPPLSSKPLRVGAGAGVMKRVRVVGGCVATVAGSRAHLLRWEMVLTFLVLKHFTRSLSRKLCHVSLLCS